MNRIDVINNLIDYTNTKKYLEVGVWRCNTITKINAKYRCGVDPFPDIKNFSDEVKEELSSISIYITTSDNFFKHNREKYGIIFIDGLHIYEQVLNDIQNSLKALANDGFIILHDCCPISEIAAGRIKSPKAWNGDVWKAIYHISMLELGISHVTLDFDCGLGIIWKTNQYDRVKININPEPGIRDLTYDVYLRKREKFLNILTYDELLYKIKTTRC